MEDIQINQRRKKHEQKIYKGSISNSFGCFLIEMFPLSTFAQTTEEENHNHGEEFSSEEVLAEIENEVVEQRSEYTKHYRLTDGTYIAATYKEPVHYQKDGEWCEINNTLILQEVDGESYYVNTASDKKFMLPKEINDNSIKFTASTGHRNYKRRSCDCV